MTGLSEATTIERAHAILAEAAGVPRENRKWGDFRTTAQELVSQFKRDRKLPAGRLGEILGDYGVKLDHDAAIRSEQGAAMQAFVDARRELSATPAGFRDVFVRDEGSKSLLKLRIPVAMILEG